MTLSEARRIIGFNLGSANKGKKKNISAEVREQRREHMRAVAQAYWRRKQVEKELNSEDTK